VTDVASRCPTLPICSTDVASRCHYSSLTVLDKALVNGLTRVYRTSTAWRSTSGSPIPTTSGWVQSVPASYKIASRTSSLPEPPKCRNVPVRSVPVLEHLFVLSSFLAKDPSRQLMHPWFRQQFNEQIRNVRVRSVLLSHTNRSSSNLLSNVMMRSRIALLLQT
jgi:hypothetical protein